MLKRSICIQFQQLQPYRKANKLPSRWRCSCHDGCSQTDSLWKVIEVKRYQGFSANVMQPSHPVSVNCYATNSYEDHVSGGNYFVIVLVILWDFPCVTILFVTIHGCRTLSNAFHIHYLPRKHAHWGNIGRYTSYPLANRIKHKVAVGSVMWSVILLTFIFT